MEQQENLVALTTNQNQRERVQGITNWRMKKTVDSIERDGKKWHWCPKHVVPGTYDGLYVTHKPEDHDEWKKKRDDWRAENKGNKSKPSDEARTQDGGDKKLALTETL